jgi:hypothetical protein
MTQGIESGFPVFQTFINSFHYLYQDAEYLHNMAKSTQLAGKFEQVRLSRTAILLYILSFEGLINRAMDHFLPEELRDYFLEREEQFSVEDKVTVLILLASQDSSNKLDKSIYPWSHFSELIKLRNDFVHPKHNRPAYYKMISRGKFDPLSWNEIPEQLGIKEKDVVYRQSRIPKDPYSILPEHVDRAKEIVDDTIKYLDKLIGGKILKDDWHTKDNFMQIYPPKT